MRMRYLLLGLAAIAAPATAASLTATKTATVISDPVGATAVPRSLPGAIVEYKITVTNPALNSGLPVRNMVFEDQLPANVVMRVADLNGSNSGPVVYTDGVSVLGVGDSGMTYTFSGLASTSDGLDFYDGVSWGYTPVADASGYDSKVRAIRVKPLTTFKTSGSFSLRFRVMIR